MMSWQKGLRTSQLEKAAQKLAWLSAQTPLTTPRRFVQPILDHYQLKALLQIIVACSIASMVQRFVANSKPKLEPEVIQFLIENDLERDPLILRYCLAASERWGTDRFFPSHCLTLFSPIFITKCHELQFAPH